MKPRALLAALLFSLVTLLAGVSPAYAQTERSLVGSWVQEGPGHSVWKFRSDGTGFMEQGVTKSTARFTWKLHGDSLELSASGTCVPYKVEQNDGVVLVLRNTYSSVVYRFQRSNEK